MSKKRNRTNTQAIRKGSIRSQYHEHSEAIFLTSSFIYPDSATGAKLFEKSLPYTYSRYDNPNNTMLEERIASLESDKKNIRAISFSSGLAAHLALLITFLQSGDEMISATDIFGATHRLYDFWFRKFNINTKFILGSKTESFKQSLTSKTKIVYLESPSNPLNTIIDIRAIAEIIKTHNQNSPKKVLLVVDNTFSTSINQKPIDLGADLVTYSATKLMDGQGRVLGGAVVGKQEDIDEMRSFLRSGGLSLSPFNAWVIYKSLETLKIRVDKQTEQAEKIANFLEHHPKVQQVYYPFLKSHPQYQLAKKQMNNGGVIISFKINANQKNTWKVIDKLKIFSRTSNMGDTRSTVTHPYTTTHGKLAEKDKEKIGISKNLIRLSIGLEDLEDLLEDLDQSLSFL